MIFNNQEMAFIQESLNETFCKDIEYRVIRVVKR